MGLSEEHRLIGDAVEALLAEAAGIEQLRAVVEADTGFDASLWQTMAEEMGLVGLMVPEAYGGSGMDAQAMMLVLNETGRRLPVVPYLETAVLAVQSILVAGDDDQKAALLPEIAAGQVKATVAGLSRRPAFEGDRLKGEATHVPFGHVADQLIVFAADGSILVVPANAEGVTVTRTPNMDLTRPLSHVHFNIAVSDVTVLSNGGKAAQERIRTLASGYQAAEQTGAAAFCLEATVAYGLERKQFGRQIASFQAVKHILADMMLRIEASRSAVLYAANAIDTDGDVEDACAAAAAWATETLQKCAAEQIQLHGGVGFTWEHHAHLYFKRARSSASWLRTASQHRERIAARLLDDAA